MFSALVPVRVDLPFDLAAADLAAVTASESFLLPPILSRRVIFRGWEYDS